MKKKGKKRSRERNCFFDETSLHGLKYVNKPGKKRILWIFVLLFSCLLTYSFCRTSLEQYVNATMKVLVNSTNTPLVEADFPLITVCNANLISRNHKREMPNETMNTFIEARKFAQSCYELFKFCYFRGQPCYEAISQVLTDNGWCCTVDLRKLDRSDGSHSLVFGQPTGALLMTDLMTYDYYLSSFASEGLLVTVDAPDTYPEVLTKSTFLSPGTFSIMHLSLTKTFTTDSALSRSPEQRNCYTKDEKKLWHFDTYTQANCLIDDVISKIADECGCVGRYRGFDGFNAENSTLEECRINGSLSWMSPMEYEQCTERGTSRQKALSSTACPSTCLVNCDESRYTVEVSSSKIPGFMGLCSENDDFDDHVVCLYQDLAWCVGGKVCDTLYLYETGEPEDDMHLDKRKSLCTPLVKRMWESCGNILLADPANRNPAGLKECVVGNSTVEERVQLKRDLSKYANENLVVTEVMFREKYYTSIMRDVSYTFSSLIANVGGLLGLSMGCSIISIAEIVVFCCGQLPCFGKKKRGSRRGDVVSSKQNEFHM